jgi:signal transduction histidine kinase
LFLFLGLTPVVGKAQRELPGLSNAPLFTAADTMRVHELISRGSAVSWRYPDSAKRLFLEAERLSQEINYADGIGRALIGLGVVYREEGDYEQSLASFRRAMPYCLQPVYNKILPALLYNNIGIVYFSYGRYADAASYYYYALRALQGDTTAPLRTTLYNNLGGVHLRMGMPEKALAYMSRAEREARRRGDKQRLAFTLSNKGQAYVSLKRWEDAERQYAEGLTLVSETENPDIMQALEVALGELLLRLKQPERALRYMEHAVKMNDSNLQSGSLRAIQMQYSLGSAYFEVGQYERAIATLAPALEKAERLGLRDDIAGGHIALAEVYEATGRYREALNHMLAYARMRDSMFREENTRRIHQLEVRYQTAEKDKKLAESQLLIYRQQQQLQQKNTLIYIVTLSAALLTAVVLLLLVVYRNIRHRQHLQAEHIRMLEQEEELKVMQALIAGEEKERARIARELHDGIGGMLAAIQMHISAAHSRPADAARLEADMEDVRVMLEHTADEVRKTAHNLMPEVLMQHSLEEALQLYCEQINAGGNLQLELQIHGVVGPLPQSAKLSLYRIVQELIQNVVKHAGTTQAIIQLTRQPTTLSILIEDNGSGFQPNERESNGIGLHNLRSRVQALQGHLSIESAPGSGTTVYMEFEMEKLKLADRN